MQGPDGDEEREHREPKVAAVRPARKQPVPRKWKWRGLDRRQTQEGSLTDGMGERT